MTGFVVHQMWWLMLDENKKSSWGTGTWQSEPDKLIWRDKDTELWCVILRHPRFGYLCGYVGIPKTEKKVDDAPVHGGVTWVGELPQHFADDDSGLKTFLWVGFDCIHASDYAPGAPELSMNQDQYRDIVYVKKECTKLARYLKDLK